MTFKWTKHFRAYDLDSFTGSDNSIPGHPQRYKFIKGNGDTVITNEKENFIQESRPSFLGWHSDDMRAAFGFRKFAGLASALFSWPQWLPSGTNCAGSVSLEPHPFQEHLIGLGPFISEPGPFICALGGFIWGFSGPAYLDIWTCLSEAQQQLSL